MKNIVQMVALMLCAASIGFAPAQTAESKPVESKPGAPVLREPFTLKLRVDKDHFYEERYDRRIPYVSENEVYLFSGDRFGVNVTIRNNRIMQVTYQPDPAKADVLFAFEQLKETQKGTGMILNIQNGLKQRLIMDALMTVTDKKEVFKTSILPVEAGKSGVESWPHPIVQLVLGNLQLAPPAASEPKK